MRMTLGLKSYNSHIQTSLCWREVLIRLQGQELGTQCIAMDGFSIRKTDGFTMFLEFSYAYPTFGKKLGRQVKYHTTVDSNEK